MAWTVGAILTASQLNTYLPTAWTTWSSPTVSGLTKGNGTETAAYLDRGVEVLCYYKFVLGSTSAVTGDLGITTPTSMITEGVFASGGSYFIDTGTASYQCHVLSVGTGGVQLRPVLVSGTYATVSTATSATIPFTWTTSDAIIAMFGYRKV